MRLVIRHSGTLDIDILRGGGLAAPEIAPEPPQSEPGLADDFRGSRSFHDTAASSSLEDALFLGLVLLLQRHYEQTGVVPTRTMLMASRHVLESLEERGNIPDASGHDSRFLAKLLAILEQVSTEPYIAELIDDIRRLILDEADKADSDNGGSENDGSSNGVSKSSLEDDEDDDDGGPDGSNGQEGGSNGTPAGGNGTSGPIGIC